MGDVHGAFRALIQCLERSEFDYSEDTLFFLGDVSDGWPETRECVEELLKIRNLIPILGNHDFWTLEWMRDEIAEDVWLAQGGRATVESYRHGIPEAHLHYFQNCKPYYVHNNMLFVHAGIDPALNIEVQTIQTFLWDRRLARAAYESHLSGTPMKHTAYNRVFLGHTPVGHVPIISGDICLMDTGAGWSGVLTMMDLATQEIFSSDRVPSLYPGIQGRSKK